MATLPAIQISTANAVLPVTLSATGLPAGLTLTDNGDGTGTITGTIAEGESANSPFTVAVTGTDANGQTHTESFTFEVASAIHEGPYNVALVVNDPAHGATTNTKAALEASGHTVTVFVDTDYATNDYAGQDVIVLCRACDTQTKVDPIIAAWEAGTPVVFGSTSALTAGTGRVMSATLANLTGTWELIGNADGGTEVDIINASSPGITSKYGIERKTFYTAANFMYAVDSGAPFVGTALVDGDPDELTAGQHTLIAVEEGTERLNAAGPAPTRAVVFGDIYGGQSTYTAFGVELLDRCLQWAMGMPLETVYVTINLAAAEGQVLSVSDHNRLSAVEGQVLSVSDRNRMAAAEMQALVAADHNRLSAAELQVLVQN